MSEKTTELIENSNRAELNAYLNFKKRAFEEVANSESESSQSSMSDLEIKRTRKIDYFSGPGEKKWVPNRSLILGGINITKQFLKFRQRNIKTVEKTGSINTMRVLSLSFIFPVNKLDSNLCISSYARGIKNELHAYAYKNNNMMKVSEEAVVYCKSISDALDEGVDVSTIQFQAATEIDEKLMAVCLEFISTLISSNQRSEDTFIDKNLKPLIREVILKSCDGSIIYSGYLKRPNRFSKYQVEDDLCKLLKQMKDSIDTQAKIGIENPTAMGLLCEGFVCSLIEMTLVEEGIYLPVTLRKFKLPESNMDIMGIPRAVECLFFVLEEVRNFEAKYNKRSKKAAVKSLVKPSFVTKFIKTEENQEEYQEEIKKK
ncbi:MAG: hypothetical protein EXX96DRAFT_472774 [Benjaminiella poitrasii]|nr:MAG: hypothetical protein EXX96DRAFT_472774 [Benjaminiella poitrasii]